MGMELDELENFLFYELNENADQAIGSIATEAAGGNYVKHSLKSKILERRQSLGLGHIKVDFSPKQLYPMTEVELEKERKRKESNRISAKRCRRKQKEEYERNKMLLDQLKEDQERLLSKVNEVEEEKNKVLFALKQLLPDSYILETLKQINSQDLHHGNISRKDKQEMCKVMEQSQVLPDIEEDIAVSYITDEQSLFEDDSLENNAPLFSSLIYVTEEDRIPASDSMVNSDEDSDVDNDILLSLFTQ